MGIQCLYIYIYIYIYNIEHRISKHEKHSRLLSSGTKLFMTFEFKGSSTLGERYTFFLFWLFHLPPPPISCDTRLRPPRASESQPSSPEVGFNSTQLTDFFKIPKSSACFWCVTSFVLASPISHLGYCDISE